MKPIYDPRWRVGRAAAITTLLLSAACAHETQAQARSAPARGATNMQPPSVPNTPTAAHVSISADVLRACNIPDSDAYFGFDSAHLTAFDHGPLDSVATCFTSGPMKGRKLRLVGRADPRGTPEYNMTLGQSRADSVANYLAAHGMNRNNESSTSRGEMDATGHDETSWAHDRRVDVSLAD